MEIDDDIVLIKDNKPKEPTEDPLEVHPGESQYYAEFSKQATLNSNINKTDNLADNVINLDSSDDETCEIDQRKGEPSSELKGNTPIGIRQSTKNKSGNGVILRTVLEKTTKTLNQSPLTNDIIDLDAEDSDPLAPLRSFMNSKLKIKNKPNLHTKKNNNCSDITKTRNSHIKSAVKTLHNSKPRGNTSQLPLSLPPNAQRTKISLKTSNKSLKVKGQTEGQTSAADVSKKLTYLGKIIRIPGQPNLIEDPSGLIFRTNSSSGLNDGEGDSSSETDMNLYKNFLINVVSGQDKPNTNQNVLVKDLFIQKANQNVNTTSLKSLDGSTPDNRSPKNINNKQLVRKQIIMNKSAKTTIIHVKKSQPNRNGGQNIKKQANEQHASILNPYQPHKPNSTVLDLNLNINDTGSPSTTNSLNTTSPPQSRNDAAGGYNVALGLVVNVNDMNQSNSNYHQMAPQFTSLNNVALDVSFNVNNKGKPATITSKQAMQNLPTPVESVSYKDSLKDFTNNSIGNLYCCGHCSFKTGNVKLIKSHLCPSSSSVTAVPSHKEEQMQISSNKNNEHPIRHITGDTYFCTLCSFKTLDSDLLKLHESSHYTTDIDTSNTNQHLTTDLSMEKMYCCVACSFQTTNFDVINEHICPAVNPVIINNENSYLKPNLEHTVIPLQNTSVETEGDQKTKEQNIYNCATCSYQTTNLALMSCHECCSINEESIGTANSNSQTNQITSKETLATKEQKEKNSSTKFYCCVSCPFRTAVFEFAQTHRCREGTTLSINVPPLAIPDKRVPDDQALANLSNNLQSSFSGSFAFTCEICKKSFRSKFPLFQHLRRTHFNVRKLFGCYICHCTFEDGDDLLRHLEEKHNSVVTSVKCAAVSREEVYRCSACQYETRILRNMKPHFDKHMEDYQSIMEISWRSFVQDVLQDTPKNDDIFVYDCILCGRKSNSILIWLKHLCKDPSKESNTKRAKQRGPLEYKVQTVQTVHRPGTVRRTYKRKCTEPLSSGKLPGIATEDPVRSSQTSGCLCFHCKQLIIDDGLKCDNSECEHFYHLRCVEICGRWLTPDAINGTSNWFCLECNKEYTTVQDDIDNVEWCMNIANKAYLGEVEKQSMWINEVKKMKQEKLAVKEEFERIKKFIMDSKSDRINNDMVKSVCTIVESFINAGVDSSD